jgi:hypothetical protein
VLSGRADGGLELVERLLIGLLGHWTPTVRQRAVEMLDCVLAGHAWHYGTSGQCEMQVCFVGDPAVVAVRGGPAALQLFRPGKTDKKTTDSVWFLVSDDERDIDCGKFDHPGLWDWQLISVADGSALGPHGRFVVLPSEARLRAPVIPLRELEDGGGGRSKPPPRSVVCTIEQPTPSDRHCTDNAARLVQRATWHPAVVAVSVDLWLAVSAAHWHRRYENLVCHEFDSATKAASTAFEGNDTVLLNYRSVTCWDALVEDVLSWAKAGATRVVLRGRLPSIAPLNHDEMFRLDHDGALHHSSAAILE